MNDGSAAERSAFIKWAQQSLAPLPRLAPGNDTADLAALGKIIGDASVVSLSEGEHFAAEPLEFRNRVLEYLVAKKGFTAIAIESGIVESRGLYNYVRGGPGELSEVVTQGISWTFDQLPQNRAMIQWLRAYNADPRHTRKISLYGFDIPGSPSNPRAKRGAHTALVAVLKYLERVDANAAATFHERLDGLMPFVRFEPYRPADISGYHSLSQAQRDSLTAIIVDLSALIERREAQYVATGSQDEYEWIHRAAIGARQTDNWLRQLPVGWNTPSELSFLDVASDVRDRAQADNLEWILRQEGPRGKVLVYAHNNHNSTASVRRSWYALDSNGQVQPGPARSYLRDEVAGGYLRRRLGDRLITIGNVIGSGELGAAGFRRILEQPAPESLDGIARDVGVPLFLLDLRAVPAKLGRWLNQPREIGRMYEVYKKARLRSELAVCSAFDVLLFVDTVKAAYETQEQK